MKRSIKKHTITSINSIKFLFQLNGLKLEETDSFKTSIYRFLYCFNFLWLNFDATGEIIWFCDGIQSGKPFVGLAYVVPCVMICILSNIKMILHNFNETDVAILINSFKELEDDEFNNTDTGKHSKEKIYDCEISYLKSILKIVKVLNFLTIIAFGLAPFVLMGVKYLDTKEFVPILPFHVKYYFFDPYDMKYYGLLYLHQAWAMFICLTGLAGVDMLFCTICANLLNKVHSEEFIVNFFTSSLLICLTALIIWVSEDTSFKISFLSFLVTSLQQLFLLCYFGDMVMTCSINLSDSVYKSLWHLATPNIRKELAFIIYRSQKPCKIRASGFIDVNLVVFTKIISKTWSLFALLRTIVNP